VVRPEGPLEQGASRSLEHVLPGAGGGRRHRRGGEGDVDIQIDILPVVAAVVAGATAYVQTKQHEALASAYTVANLELADIAELLPAVADEKHWARFVDEAENAISREHTMWKARRTERKKSTDEPEGDAEADGAKPDGADADAEQV